MNKIKRIILMGNPNVGKSVIFSRLTGVRVIASNYPGTTVEYTKGYMNFKGNMIEVIDAPGTYSLEADSPAEKVAVKMLEQAKSSDDTVVINIINSTNLERSLNLTLDLLKSGIPMVVALNLWDEAQHIGIEIDKDKLQKILGVPVISTCAITGEGIKELVESLSEASTNTLDFDEETRWSVIGKIIKDVQKVRHKHHTAIEKFRDATIKPLTGFPIAAVILFLSFGLIRFIGESLINYIFDPIFEKGWLPIILKLSKFLGPGILHDILIGTLKQGEIDFVESLGLLTTGLYVPLAAVLPYVIAFYFVLGLLEDSGYLPRLGVLLDGFFHKIGLHGFAFIPMLLGLGCNVPGALATRIMETRRERFISATLLAISVPCMAQIAMIFGLLGKYGTLPLLLVFGTLFIVWLILGIILNFTLKGTSPEIFVEIPPYRKPYFGVVGQKLWLRVKGFLKDAIPFVLLGVLIVNILYATRILDYITKFAQPMLTKLFGLPGSAIIALTIGFLRKDVAVGMLAPLGLTTKQLIIASTVLTIYFPCVATFTVLAKELGLRDMLKSLGVMLVTALIIGSIQNLLIP